MKNIKNAQNKGFIQWLALAAIALVVGAVALGVHTKKISTDPVNYTPAPVTTPCGDSCNPQVNLGTSQPINGSTYTLSGSGVTAAATSITLTSFTIPQNGYKITDADVSSTFYMTLEPGSRTRQEVVSCTTVVQNANGSATMSGCTRGLSPIQPYTASTTLKFAHAGGSQVIFGDAAQLFNEYAATQNTESITGKWTFALANRPTLDGDADTGNANDLITFGQLSRTSFAGVSDASESVKGIAEAGTAVEQASSTAVGSTAAVTFVQTKNATSSPVRGCDGTATAGALCVPVTRNDGKINPNFIATSSTDTYNFGGSVALNGTNTHLGLNTFSATTTFATTTQNGAQFGGNIVNTFTGGMTITGATTPQPVMLATSTNQVSVIDSDVASTTGEFVGFVINNCSLGTSCYVQTDGIVKGFTGLTAGLEYYVSDTAGVLSSTVGTAENYVGRAFSTTQIWIDKGARAGLQYLSSTAVSGSAATTYSIPLFARFGLISIGGSECGGGGESASTDLWIAKNGKTSGTGGFTAPSSVGVKPTASWSGNTLTVNSTGCATYSYSGTVYWYR